MYKCCIFDLDGTIIDTIQSLTNVTNMMLKSFDLLPVDLEHMKKFAGNGYKKLVERALIYGGDVNLNFYEEALKRYNDFSKKHCLENIRAFEGINDFLQYLKDKNIFLAVVTNKSHSRALETIKEVYGTDVFDMITGVQEGVACKPDPSGTLLTAKTLGVKSEQCLYFGDTNTDMETGRNAGMDTVGVTWGFRERKELEEYTPKFIIDKIEEIYSVFENNE